MGVLYVVRFGCEAWLTSLKALYQFDRQQPSAQQRILLREKNTPCQSTNELDAIGEQGDHSRR